MSVRPENCFFLTVKIVREIHAKSISTFGGKSGVRDTALLESAVSAPQAGFGGASAFKDITEIAAAYLFYICRNHPFIDGNKRTALASCVVFLRLNGIEPGEDESRWFDLVMRVAAGELDRVKTTKLLRAPVPKIR